MSRSRSATAPRSAGGHAVDLLQCVEITIGKEPITYQETCTEFIYGVGREIAGMLGGGDGCYGTAVAKALVNVGAIPRKLIGPYDGNRAKQWGGSGRPRRVEDDRGPVQGRLGRPDHDP